MTTLSQIRGGFQNVSQSANMASRSTSQLNMWLRAVGTTIRYAFAGTAVFGMVNAVQQLESMQRIMADIAALGEEPGTGQPLAVGKLRMIRDELLDMSARLAVPMEDLQNVVADTYSSFQNINTDQVLRLADATSKLTIAAGARDPRETGAGLRAALTSFGIPVGRAPETAGQIAAFIRKAALFRGEEFGKFTPQAFAGAAQAGLDFPQTLALLTIGTRFGGTAAVAGRHAGQLFRNLMNPVSEDAQKAYREIGLGERELETLSPIEVLRRIRKAVGRVRVERWTGAQMESVEGEESLSNRQLGISGARGRLLARLFPRAESRRFAGLLFQGWEGDKTHESFQVLDRDFRDVNKQLLIMEDRIQRALGEMPITRIRQNFRNLATAIVGEFDPVFQQFARFSKFMQGTFGERGEKSLGIPGQPGINRRHGLLAGMGAAMIGLLGLSRVLGRGAGGSIMGRLLGRIPGAGLAGAQALQSGFGNRPPMGTPTDPLYVVVMYQLAGPGGIFGTAGLGGLPLPGRGGGTDAKGRRRFPVIPMIGTAGWALAALAVYDEIQSQGLGPALKGPGLQPKPTKNVLLDALTQKRGGVSLPSLPGLFGLGPRNITTIGEGTRFRPTPKEERILERLEKGYINEQVAERLLRQVAPRGQLSELGLAREMKLTVKPAKLTVQIQDKKGKQIGRKGYNIDLFGSFTAPPPRHRGKPRNSNRSN